MVECYCCGEQRAVDDGLLLCHDEITLCRICLGWLMTRAGGVEVTPTLPVRDMDEATRFCEAAGFDVEHYSDDFAFVHFRDRSVFDLDRVSELDPATNHGGCYIITEETDDWHARFVAAGLRVTPIEDMPWACTSSPLPIPVATTSGSAATHQPRCRDDEDRCRRRQRGTTACGLLVLRRSHCSGQPAPTPRASRGRRVLPVRRFACGASGPSKG